MTDFDFDELDRAVTGSLEGGMEGDGDGNDSIKDGAKDGNDTAALSSPAMQRTTAGMGGAHPFHAARFEAAPIARHQESQDRSQGQSHGQWVSNGNGVKTTTASTSAHSPLRASSGRFMDIVHPSSDMRSSGTSKSKFRPPVSHGHTNDNGHADDHGYSHGHGYGHGGNKAEAVSTSNAHSAVKNATAKSSLDEFAKPLESPFLPDAKVEKRPLGGAGGPLPVSSPASASAPASALATLEFESAPVSVSSVETSKSVSKQPFTTDLPKEPLLDEPDEPRLEAPDELRLDDGDDSANSANSNANTTTANAAGGTSSYNGATSIHQQYKEQPSATSAQPGALYDTEAYHQPLQHAEKKHSGFWVIFWILLLVLVGAGIGAAAYFFVIPLI